MSASDNDSDKKLRFRLLGVSNSGKSRFAVNSRTGVVEVVGPVEAGERFSLTIGVIDSGGKESQGIMEVRRQPILEIPCTLQSKIRSFMIVSFVIYQIPF